ncbi:MAG: hypothetical protein AAGI71_03385 [Bacteroidota bacterium]
MRHKPLFLLFASVLIAACSEAPPPDASAPLSISVDLPASWTQVYATDTVDMGLYIARNLETDQYVFIASRDECKALTDRLALTDERLAEALTAAIVQRTAPEARDEVSPGAYKVFSPFTGADQPDRVVMMVNAYQWPEGEYCYTAQFGAPEAQFEASQADFASIAHSVRLVSAD